MFFSDPLETKDGYLVLKGNIHVTLAMTRLRLMSVLKRLVKNVTADDLIKAFLEKTC